MEFQKLICESQRRWGSSVRPAVLSCRAAGRWGLRCACRSLVISAHVPSSLCDGQHKLSLLILCTTLRALLTNKKPRAGPEADGKC
jgi:hypothetical protein